jgi:DNA polymerase I-like protein with 3'-5' exonuclease and polymerase domains
MPDKTVDPTKGYPLLCTRSQDGSYILPTVPLNYHVSGTAMQWTNKAMIRVDEWLNRRNATIPDEQHINIIMQVHDEMVYVAPKGKGKEPWKTNLPTIRKIQALMEQGGEDIGVPTPVSVEYHATNWSEGLIL